MGFEVCAPAVRTVEVRPFEPRDPRAGEVRIAVQRCGICGSDLHFFAGRQPLPTVCPGHEISGIVDAVGDRNAGCREGDRVVVEPLARCRVCDHCRAGDYNLCSKIQIYGLTSPGGMATSLIVPAYCALPLPDTVGFAIGALAEPTAVAVHALRLARAGEGSRVLILGAGTIGLLTAAAARHLGAETIAITARYAHQREAATRLGCDEILDPQSPRASVRPNVVIETVGGHASTVDDGVKAVEAGGIVVITGLFDVTPKFDPLTMMVKEVRLVASMVYNRADGRSDFEIALDILESRRDELAAVVTHEFPLDRAQQAFDTAADKATGAIKVLLDPATSG